MKNNNNKTLFIRPGYGLDRACSRAQPTGLGKWWGQAVPSP
ncbi:hypothetical protein BVRB_6g154210 [Beta vulgaris subsp. vulgaris]|nr:hypothetical protein BVRB_6g154210 [Beta vulgaris subsp. vulgaris]